MHTKFHTHLSRIIFGLLLAGVTLLSGSSGNDLPMFRLEKMMASQPGAQQTSITLPGTLQTSQAGVFETLISSSKTHLEKHTIVDPIVSPLGVESGIQPQTLPKSRSTKIRVKECKYVYGCSAVSGGHAIAGLDRGGKYIIYTTVSCSSGSSIASASSTDALGGDSQVQDSCGIVSEWVENPNIVWVNMNSYPNLYTGPTNGGVLPQDNSYWANWTDACGDTYPNNPVVASHQGVDGRSTRGSIDDYWVCYESTEPDPYITGGWTPHTWGDAIGDYMYTSQSAFGNVDGATSFFIDNTSATPVTCDELSSNSMPDGTLGMKQFYQARGYAVSTCYNQPTDNTIAGGFSFAQFKAEIDAGWPVLLGLEGHTVVGVGYDPIARLIYVSNGWDNGVHPMEWQNGCYDQHCFVSYKYPDAPPYDYVLPLEFASVVHIVFGTPSLYTISGNVGMAGAAITYTGGATTADNSGNYSFTVSESWFGTVTPSKAGYNFTPPSSSYKNVRENHTSQNYIATDSDFPTPFGKNSPPNSASNQPTTLILSWGTSIGAASYQYCYDTTNDSACSNWISNGASTSKTLSSLNGNTTYYWHVRAVNSSGTTYADNGAASFWSFTTAPLTPVQIIDTWTADGNWNPKTSFKPGDPIQWAMDISNTTGSQKQATLIFVVKNPAGATILNWQSLEPIDDGYWSISLSSTTLTMEGTYTFTGSVIYQGIRTDKSTTYTVNVPCYTLSMSTLPIGYGTINANPPPNCNNGSQYRQGTIIQITALPFDGYVFDVWSGDSTASLNPNSITMTVDTSITANFIMPPPAAPRLISPGNGEILAVSSPTLDWKDLAFLPGHYQVQFATNNNFTSGLLYDQITTQSSYAIPSSLIPGNLYYWRVRAFNSIGQAGDWSETWVISIKLSSVNLLTPDMNTQLPNLRPTFDWSDAPNTGIYTIQISKSENFIPFIVNEASQTSDFIPLIDLPPAQTLYWRVRSEGGGGDSNWSIVRSFTTPDPPSIPTPVLPNPDAISMDYQPLFKWNQSIMPDNTEFDHYQIQISTDQAFSTLTINSNLSGVTTKTYMPPTNLASNTTYYWHIRAYNTDSEVSGWSETRSFRTPNPLVENDRPRIYDSDPTLPVPTIIVPTINGTLSSLQPVLDWADMPNATGYIVQVSTDPAFTSPFVASATTIESQYAFIREVPTGITLYWRALTIYNNTISNWSSVSTFSVP